MGTSTNKETKQCEGKKYCLKVLSRQFFDKKSYSLVQIKKSKKKSNYGRRQNFEKVLTRHFLLTAVSWPGAPRHPRGESRPKSRTGTPETTKVGGEARNIIFSIAPSPRHFLLVDHMHATGRFVCCMMWVTLWW